VGEGMRYLTGSKQRDMAVQQALLDRMSAGFERSVARILSKTMKAAVKQYQTDQSAFSVEAKVQEFDKQLSSVMSTEIKRVIEVFGNRIAGARKKDMGVDPFDDALKNYFALYGLVHVQNISHTTAKQLKALISQGELEGLGVEAIARNISKVIPSISRYRAHTIARTETHTAANVGAQAAAESLGLNLMKEWMAASDERTRESHADADGQQVGLNESFSVGGVELAYPGDPSGPPEEVINCFTGDTLVSFKSCKKAIRSNYTGEIITIKTSAGYEVSGTPNHPVLTDNGFIRLDQVNHLTNLVCCPINKNFSGAFNVNYIPSKFKEVFDSFLVIGMVMRKVAVGVNLYGRIPDGDVNVININGFLHNTFLAKRLKLIKKLNLKAPNFTKTLLFCFRLLDRVLSVKFFPKVSNSFVGFFDLISSLLPIHFRPFKNLRFVLVPNIDIRFFKAGSNTTTANPQRLSNSVFAFSGKIKADGFVSYLNPFFGSKYFFRFKNFVNGRNRSIDSKSNFFSGSSRFVHTDNAVFINKNFVHNIPVYTLETKEGLYNAGGIISGNCRCSVSYIEI
jgi:hypothetical protein